MDDPKSIYGADQPPPLARRRPGEGFPSAPKTPDPFRHHSHRRRRRRSKSEESQVQGWLWMLALLLVAGYVGYLAYSRKHPLLVARPAQPIVPVATPSIPLPPPVLAGVPDTKPERAARPDEVLQHILDWTAARRALPDAAELQRDGKLDDAVVRLRDALGRNPSDLDLRSALAEVLFQQRRFLEAEHALMQVLAADPERQAARQMLALVYDNLHLHEHALAVINWMLEKDPYALEIHEMAARTCLALNRAADAVVHLKKVTGVQHDNVAALTLLAQAYTLQGQYAQAETTLQTVTRLDAKNSSSYYNLAVCRSRQNQVTGVVEVLNTAVTLFGAPFVASWVGSAEFAACRTNAAFASWQKSLEATPAPAVTNGVAGAAPAP